MQGVTGEIPGIYNLSSRGVYPMTPPRTPFAPQHFGGLNFGVWASPPIAKNGRQNFTLRYYLQQDWIENKQKFSEKSLERIKYRWSGIRV